MFWGMTAGSGGNLQGSVTCQSLADHRPADFLRLSSALRKLVGFFFFFFFCWLASLVAICDLSVLGMLSYPQTIV